MDKCYGSELGSSCLNHPPNSPASCLSAKGAAGPGPGDGDLFLADTWFTRALIIPSSSSGFSNNHPACLVHSVVLDSWAFLFNCMFILFFMYLVYSLCSRHSGQLASCPANWALLGSFLLMLCGLVSSYRVFIGSSLLNPGFQSWVFMGWIS